MLSLTDPDDTDVARWDSPDGQVQISKRSTELAAMRATFDALTRLALSPARSADLINNAGRNGASEPTMNTNPAITPLASPFSLARLLHHYADRWGIERVERGTEWVAVLRETSGDYIRIFGAHDLDALKYKMDQVERDEPEERDTTSR